MERLKFFRQLMLHQGDLMFQTSLMSLIMMSLNIRKTTFTGLGELVELELREKHSLYANPKSFLVESIEKLLGNQLERKFLDGFSYRDSQESLVPNPQKVSKKRNRGFGKQISFGSRRRR